MTFTELITQSLQDSRVMLVPGQTAPAEYITQGQVSLNGIFDQWTGNGTFCWSTEIQEFVLTQPYPSVGYYTLGPTGDFVGNRPSGGGPGKGITNAGIRLAGQPNAQPLGLFLFDDDQWSIVNSSIQCSVPWGLYNDGGFYDEGNCRLYFYAYPSEANTLQLFSNNQISQVTNLASTFRMAPGYQLAVRYTLAEDLCIAFGKPAGRDLERKARAARTVLAINNARVPLVQNETAGLNPNYKGYGYNYQNRSFV